IPVPAVEFVARRSIADSVLRVRARSLDRDQLSFFNRGAAFRGRSLSLAFGHRYDGLPVRIDLNAIASWLGGMKRDVRRIDLHVRLRAVQYRVDRYSLPDLHLDSVVVQRGDIGFRMLVQPQ